MQTAAEQTTQKEEQLGTESVYDSRVVSVKRTAKVTKGGRTFKFLVVVVVGDGKGRVGYAMGKANEVSTAVQKANDKARRNMIEVALRGDTLQYPMTAHYCATTIVMKPAVSGTGIIAGGALRSVFEVLGVKNVVAKCIGSTNPVNIVKTAIKSLTDMSHPVAVAKKRGKTVREILGREESEESEDVA